MRKLLVPLLFSGLAAGSARAQDASITATSGVVELVPAGGKKAVHVRRGDTMIFGDTLRTRKAGIAHVELAGGAVVLVKPDSAFTLAGDTQDPLVDFSIGEFLIGLAKKLPSGTRFRARVPSAVAAVRGTLFWGKTTADRNATFAAVGHSIEVSAQGKTVVLEPNQASSIAYGFTPEAPAGAGVTRDFLKGFSVKGSLQGLEKLADKSIP